MTSIIQAVRKQVKHPRFLTLVALDDRQWWCTRCDASGFTPSRPQHKPGCLAAKRPITWGPLDQSRFIR